MLEKDYERKSKANVEKDGGLLLKFVSPGWAGAPDRIILYPDGEIIFAEFKQRGKEPRPLQLKRHRQLKELGFRVEVIDYVIPRKTVPGVRDETNHK